MRVRGNATEHTETASRAELKRRYVPGSHGVVWPVPRRSPTDWLWFLLPIAYIVAGYGIFRLARQSVRSGVFVVLFPN